MHLNCASHCMSKWPFTWASGFVFCFILFSRFVFHRKLRTKMSVSDWLEHNVYLVYTDGSATKDQSGWGFTVKQGATTIHGDSAAIRPQPPASRDTGGKEKGEKCQHVRGNNRGLDRVVLLLTVLNILTVLYLPLISVPLFTDT